MRSGAWRLYAAVIFAAGAATAETTYTPIPFDQLDGWAQESHDEALATFLRTCSDLTDPSWRSVCAIASQTTDARAYFEHLFQPILIENGVEMLYTGYFEPEIDGSLTQTDVYRFPVYRLPPEAAQGRPWLTRQQIEESGVLANRGLEIAWLADPVDRYFMQVQGSGRIRLADGRALRIGFAGKNGYDYKSIGRALVQNGAFQSHQVSAAAIRNWARQYPAAGREAMWANPSYVFFRLLNNLDASDGPLGAMNRPLTAGRSIAVDPDYTPLGAPVWVEKDGATPIRRLMVAQDSGSAVSGAQRADIFIGSGTQAGREAAHIRDGGRMIVLLPNDLALALPVEAIQ